MPAAIKLELAEAQRVTLIAMRDYHPLAYARERAGALLKIADGQPASHVAQHGLLRRRTNETVGIWVKRYRTEGIVGLLNKAGRGRKPLFSPQRTSPSTNGGT